MVLTTSILLPLYLYPTPGAWTWVTNAITSYPSLPFTIIINPSSGPGAIHQYPENGYISGIANLTQFDNVKLLGYVDTKYMGKSVEDVDKEVETYKYWSTYTSNNISLNIDGIFFDDAISTWTTQSSNYMSTIASNAHAMNLTVTFNPGTPASAEFFNIADTIIMIEDSYSMYTSSSSSSLSSSSKGKGKDSIKTITSTKQQEKSSVILYDFDGSAEKQSEIVKEIVGAGIKEVYVTTGQYEVVSGLWMEFVEAVSRAVGY
ncbi:3acf4fc6-76cb-4594-994c-cb4e11c490fa-CDS [Sclerotinia trifoliorum]|uniref:3acf4fc6-76cb-4594-994c-cb4e11c490fa-CDS n=1 Tax=Sclerotinia trifoliorum TaxID=28548 RepID=A0A8H2W3E1_9HELO|nr:3acf4fc6-76cb-4594-994c-cb4e11c490fa-CDS [Sclerotinia trifoliorum]